jgi:glycosyltransferase involved in cell wall biosynthesis
VLFVARWYPSHDQSGRGAFVADLATALGATGGARVTVASFEPTHVRGVADTRADRAREANGVLASVVGTPDALNRPAGWGAGAAVAVARLPAILDGDRRRPADIIDAHAVTLVPFATALAARDPVDVVHAHTGMPDGLAALRVAEALDLPLLVTEHSSTAVDELVDDETRALYRRLVAPPARLVAVSRKLARDLARALGVGENVIDVLPNAVPVDAFPSGPAAGRDAADLLYVGSRKASKGIETLLRAFGDVHSRRPAVRLRLIGPPGQPAEEAHWTAVIGELGVADSVTLEPPAPREAVAEAMRQATLFVHPSQHETFGMVAAEALASGLPVAATPSGGVDEIVGRDGRFGAIAASPGVAALADAIDRGLSAAPRVDREAMRAHVVERYAADAVARRARALYDDLIVATPARLQPLTGTGGDGVGSGAGGAGKPGEVERAGAFRLPLVLALARGQAIERVGLLPAALRDRLTIVTSPRGRYADDRDLPPWATWLELDQERFYRDALAELEASARSRGVLGGLRSALGGPNVEKLRRDLVARKDTLRREGTRRFVETAVDAIPGSGPSWLVALDADDIILARELGEIARVGPGGLRWLADAWDAAGRPG